MTARFGRCIPAGIANTIGTYGNLDAYHFSVAISSGPSAKVGD